MIKRLLHVSSLCFWFVFMQHAQASTLRIACDDSAAGGEVSVNGKFKGECPIDVQVPGGAAKLKVVKTIDGKPEVFEQTIRVGDNVVKRIDVSFGGVAPASAAAPTMVDSKVLDQQRYEMEMTQYQNSIRACLPKFDAEVQRARAKVREAWRRVYNDCIANRTNSDSDAEYRRVACGNPSPNLNVNDVGSPSPPELGDEPEWKAWEDIYGSSAESWCSGQFTKPEPPAR